MNCDATPGQTGSILCHHCRGSIFFRFSGGPHTLHCPACKRPVMLEVVHDGEKWKVKRPESSS